ncbi:MAG: RidA family protein [Anaerolineae bacterium]|nr:RidA family protein [Anaerolineae bacterium]
MSKQVIQTANAPAAVGPYSQAIVAGGLVYTAGQIALVPGTTELAAGGIAEQTRQVMHNLKAILETAGSSLDQVVKVTVYLQDLNDFAAMNAVYAEFFTVAPPARSTIQAAKLPRAALVEIDCIATLTH